MRTKSLLGNPSWLLSSSASPQCTQGLFLFVYYCITVPASQAHVPLCVPIYAASTQFRLLSLSEVKRGRSGDLTRLTQQRGEALGSHSHGFFTTRAVGFQPDWQQGAWVRAVGLPKSSSSVSSLFPLPFPRITTQGPHDSMWMSLLWPINEYTLFYKLNLMCESMTSSSFRKVLVTSKRSPCDFHY